MILNEAKTIAEKYLAMFKPFCNEVMIAGSVRREKAEVKDIELVALPKAEMKMIDMFNCESIRDEGFINLVNSFNRTKGNGKGKYAQLILIEGIKLDLFIADGNNFGLIFMIRTGSAEFSKRMVTEIKSKGFYCEGGYLHSSDDDRIIPVRTEKDFFEITGMKFVEARERSL